MGSRAALTTLAILVGACSQRSELGGVTAVSNGNLADDLRLPITTSFRFAGSDPLAPASGPGSLSVFDPQATGWTTRALQFGTTDSFGLAPLPGGKAAVMHLQALTPGQGLILHHGTGANGDFASRGRVSRYTLVFDVLYPQAAEGHTRALYQTDATNKSDADFFVSDTGGIGVDGNFAGNVDDGRWHRIVVVVRADQSMGQMQKYVDGIFVGAQGQAGVPIDDRWALDANLLLFADDDGQTGEVYVSSILYIGEALLMDEVRALGGPTALGAGTPGVPGRPWPIALPHPADVFAHKGDACCAPENTLVAITRALDKGADFIEVDLQLTSDGVAVVIHDDSVDRTTNGSGAVADLSLAQLRALDAGSWFHPTFAGERIPSLAEVLAVCKGRARVYLDGISGKGPAIVEAMRQAGVGPQAVWPWAVDDHDLDELESHLPGVEILYGSIEGWTEPGFFEELASRHVSGFSIPWELLSSDFAAAAHAHGMYLEVYTVFDPGRMVDVIDAGADGMETDYPAILREMEPVVVPAP